MTAPLGPERPDGDQTCGRMTASGYCGEQAIVHIAWTPDMENGLVCPPHLAEAETEWVFYDRHPLTPLCALQDRGIVWLTSWEHPPGTCAERVADGVVYTEAFADVPSGVAP